MFIKGWEAGLIGMKKGGIRQLDIPPEEGYGAKGMPPKVPPNARLHFEIEVLHLR
jgi:FKBP-type peptidyl-prolyl cis-trans isomerase